ncbi:MAG: sulfatase-like hydrolase/transferase, partial [Planctomycetota bacterium]|nr:sulfatase-like hydrolase/transferase [Planctomycetota bacterium]
MQSKIGIPQMLARSCVLVVAASSLLGRAAGAEDGRPNILLAISDDQSFPHASAYGSKMVSTPAFDRVASEGVLLTNAICASPGCSPCRAALLTGRHTWQLEHAGTHASSFSPKYVTYPDRLESAGYFVG